MKSKDAHIILLQHGIRILWKGVPAVLPSPPVRKGRYTSSVEFLTESAVKLMLRNGYHNIDQDRRKDKVSIQRRAKELEIELPASAGCGLFLRRGERMSRRAVAR